jgi:hypothetical protein
MFPEEQRLAAWERKAICRAGRLAARTEAHASPGERTANARLVRLQSTVGRRASAGADRRVPAARVSATIEQRLCQLFAD